MTTATYAQIALSRLEPNPGNPRFSLGDLSELTESIRQQGLLEPLIIAPHATADDRYVIIAGHRRAEALRKAGHDDAPVLLRTDLDTPAKQIEAMLVENLQRAELSPIEEATAYEQLRLQGIHVTEISATTGRSATLVKGRLKLLKLPEKTREKIHQAKITLEVAEKLIEFADDPILLAKLEREAGGNNFRFALTEAKRQRDRDRARAKLTEQLEAENALVVDKPNNFGYTSQERDLHRVFNLDDDDESLYNQVADELGEDADDDAIATEWRKRLDALAEAKITEHKTCPGHAAFIDAPTYADPKITYICTDPNTHHPGWNADTHPDDNTPAARIARAEGDDSWKQRRDALETAAVARRSFIREHLAANDVAIAPVIRHAAGVLVGFWEPDDRSLEVVEDLLGLPHTDGNSADDWEQREDAVRAFLAAAPPDASVGAGLLLAVLAGGQDPDLINALSWSERERGWLELLAAAIGYEPCDIELEMLARIPKPVVDVDAPVLTDDTDTAAEPAEVDA